MNRTCFAALALCLATLLTACNGDPEPKFEDPTETPSTSSAAGSPTAEPKSPRAEERAFVTNWVQALQEAGRSGDVAAVRTHADAGCNSCTAFMSEVRKAYAGGGRIQGLTWTLTRARYVGKERGRSIWHADVESAAETWFDGDGRVVRSVPAGINYYGLELTRSGSRVLLADYYLIQR